MQQSDAVKAKLPHSHGSPLKYSAVACVGFGVDWLVLKLGVGLGLPAWGARVVSLTCAMQVTFVLNRLLVFHTLEGQSLRVQWACYMVANAFGNLCNYLTFTTCSRCISPGFRARPCCSPSAAWWPGSSTISARATWCSRAGRAA